MERTLETKVLFHNHRRKKKWKNPKKTFRSTAGDKKPGEISKRPDTALTNQGLKWQEEKWQTFRKLGMYREPEKTRANGSKLNISK